MRQPRETRSRPLLDRAHGLGLSSHAMGIVFICAMLGLLFGGLPGLMIGGLIGYFAWWALGATAADTAQHSQERFLDATFAVMGALSKADGIVTPDEIATAQHIFDMLRLSSEQRERAKEAFNHGKSPGFDLDAEVDALRRAVGFGMRRGLLLRLFLQVQCMAVSADGRVHRAEHAMLVRVARRLGLTERDVAQLEALLRAGGAGRAGAGAAGAGAARPQSRLEDAYTALGLTASASDAEVKRAYRRLMNQNHPDKLAARGVSESMRQVAEERTREINVAYDLIKESRGFN